MGDKNNYDYLYINNTNSECFDPSDPVTNKDECFECSKITNKSVQWNATNEDTNLKNTTNMLKKNNDRHFSQVNNISEEQFFSKNGNGPVDGNSQVKEQISCRSVEDKEKFSLIENMIKSQLYETAQKWNQSDSQSNLNSTSAKDGSGDHIFSDVKGDDAKVEVNKISMEQKLKWKYPPDMSPQEQRALYKDNRNLFQVLQSIINKLSAQKYDPATVQAYTKLAGYDIKIRSCDPLSGFNLLKEDIRTLIKNFKKYNYDKETDKKELSDLEEDIERKNFDVAAGLDKNRMFRYEEDVQRDIKEENDGEDIEDESEMYPEEETVQGGEKSSRRKERKVSSVSIKGICKEAQGANKGAADTMDITDMNLEVEATSPKEGFLPSSSFPPSSSILRQSSINNIPSEKYFETRKYLNPSHHQKIFQILENLNKFSSKQKAFINKLNVISARGTLNRKQRRLLDFLYSKLKLGSPENTIFNCESINTDSKYVSTLPYLDTFIQSSNLKIARNSVELLLDSGAQISIIPIGVLSKINLKLSDIDKGSRIYLKTPSQSHRNCVLGAVNLNLFFQNENGFFRTTNISFYVVNKEFNTSGRVICGSNFFHAIGATLKYKDSNCFLSGTFFNSRGEKVQETFICKSSRGLKQEIKIPIVNSTTLKEQEGCKMQMLHTINFGGLKGFYKIKSGDPKVKLQSRYVFLINKIPSVVLTNDKDVPWLISNSDFLQINCLNYKGVNVQDLTFCETNYEEIKKNISTEDQTSTDAQVILSAPSQPQGPTLQDGLDQGGPTSGEFTQEGFTPEKSINNISDQKETCSHYFHLPDCTTCHDQTQQCSSLNNEDCICPRKIESKQQKALFESNKMKIKRKMAEVQNIFQEKNSASPIEPSPQGVDEPIFEKNDLMNSFSVNESMKMTHLSADLQKKIKRLNNQYPEVWSTEKHKLGRFKYFEIPLKVENPKLAHQKDRQVSFANCKKAREKVEELLQLGVLAEVDFVPENISNWVLVRKPPKDSILRATSKADMHIARQQAIRSRDEVEYRLAVDFSSLNRQLIGTKYVRLPRLQEIKEATRGKIVSSFDVKDGFFNISVTKESQKYLAVYYEDRLLCFTRTPQGLSISPLIFVSAMKASFTAELLQEFLARKGWTKKEFPFQECSEFLSYYVDDIIVWTDKDNPDLHLRCIEAMYWLLERAGLPLSPGKCKFMNKEFSFLGHVLRPSENFSEMAPERAAAIMDFRCPLSRAETLSRLSACLYSSEYLCALRLISIPLYQMAHGPEFFWQKEQAEAWTEIKFLCSLRIRNYTFRPDWLQIMTTDASKVAAAWCHFQLNDKGRLELVATGGKQLSLAQIRSPSVIREAAALMLGVHELRGYIMQATKGFIALTDASALVFLSRNKNVESRFYEHCIILSQYPQLQMAFLPGVHLGLADVISRGFQDAYIKDKTPLSEKAARIIPPIPRDLITKISKLNHEQLTDFLLRETPPEWIDLFDRCVYRQPTSGVHNSELEKVLPSLASEERVLAFLTGGFYNKDIYKLKYIKELLRQTKVLSKANFTNIVRGWKLGGLLEILEKLNIKDKFLSNLRLIQNEEDKGKVSYKINYVQLNAVMTRSKSKLNPVPTPENIDKLEFKRKSMKKGPKRNHDQNKRVLPPEGEIPTKQGDPTLSEPTDILGDQYHARDTDIMTNIPQSDLRSQSDNFNNSSKQHQAEIKCKSNCPHDSLMEKYFYRLYNENREKIHQLMNCFLELIELADSTSELDKYRKEFQNTDCQIMKFQTFLKCWSNILVKLTECRLNFNSKNEDSTCKKLALYVYYYQSSLFEIRFRSTGCDFLLRKDINMTPFSSQYLDLEMFLSARVPCTLESHLGDTYHLELQFLDSIYIYCKNPLIFNLSNTHQQLIKGNIIFSLNFEQITESYIPVRVTRDVVMQRIDNLTAIFQHSHVSDIKTMFQKYSDYAECNLLTKIENESLNEKSRAKLNQLLLSNFIFRNNELSQAQLEHLQNRDSVICSIKEKLNRGKANSYTLIHGLLYYSNENVDNQKLLKLVLPELLAILLFKSYHVIGRTAAHLNPKQMIRLLETIFKIPNAETLATNVYKGCLVCIRNQPRLKLKSIGKTRTYIEMNCKIGDYWFSDVCYLPQSAGIFGKTYQAAILFVEALSGYITCYPVRQINSTATLESFKSLLSFYPFVQVIATDAGPEYSKYFTEFCQKMNILHATSRPGVSNPQSQVEVSIRLIKEMLTTLTNQTSNTQRLNWPEYLFYALQNVNSNILYQSKLSRKALFFSPLHTQYVPAQLDQNDEIINYHIKNYSDFIRLKQRTLGRLSKKFSRDFRVGQIVKLVKADFEQSTQNESRALISPSTEYYKIIKILPGSLSYICLNLENGSRRTLSHDNIRSLSLLDLSGIKFDSSDLFKDIAINRTNTQYKKLNRGLILSKQDEETAQQEWRRDETNVNCLSIFSVSILKIKQQGSVIFDKYKLSYVAMEAILRAIYICEELGIPLTSFQKQFKSQNFIKESLQRLQNYIPSENLEYLMRRKKQTKKVRFQDDSLDKQQSRTRNIYTLGARLKALQFSCSLEEMKYLN